MESKEVSNHEKCAIYYNKWCKSNKPNNYSEARNSVDFADSWANHQNASLIEENNRLRETLKKAIRLNDFGYRYKLSDHLKKAEQILSETERKEHLKDMMRDDEKDGLYQSNE